MSSVQSNIASGYLSSFENPIGVSVMAKAQSWPFLQKLTFGSTLDMQKSTFHGLGDFKSQMQRYSSTHWILTAAWRVVQMLVPNNSSVASLMYNDPALGPVGKVFKELPSFGQVFALSPSELKNPSAVRAKVSALSS